MPFHLLASEAGCLQLCGHRGHSVGAPENTLPALVAAAGSGASICEIDVVLSRDEQIVLLHDEILDRTTNGHGKVADQDLADLRKLDAGSWFDQHFEGTPIPMLEQAIATARQHGLGLLVEIKERQRADRMIERLADLIEGENALEDVVVISFDHPSLLRVKERLPALRTEIITHARHVDPVGMAQRAGASSVSVEWDMFDALDARALHAAGIAVRVTLPKPERLAVRRKHGFDDDARLVHALEEGLIDVLAGDDVAFLARLVRDRRSPA